MPSLSTLAVFALAALALVAIPGPSVIYITTRSISDGRRAGLASALGIETGTLVHVAAAAVGLSALVASSAAAFETVRYLGAAYLVFLGVRTLLRRGAAAASLRGLRHRRVSGGVYLALGAAAALTGGGSD
jgi:threonine/homoserine/homoserine lactone efflux protein